MTRHSRSPRTALIAIWAILLLSGANAMALEEPKYEVVRTYPVFELRRYAPYLVAETQVKGDFDEVGNQAFRILADYIFGNNLSETKMAMTAPVNQRPANGASETLAMTAPVIQRPSDGGDSGQGYVFSFVMPSGYRLDTLPQPNNPQVTLREEPARLMAARRYSGRWTQENYRENERMLLMALREAGLKPSGEPVYARYNPPFMPWFMRRNEVMVPVEDPS